MGSALCDSAELCIGDRCRLLKWKKSPGRLIRKLFILNYPRGKNLASPVSILQAQTGIVFSTAAFRVGTEHEITPQTSEAK
jgi:hypothetical protein